MSHNWCEFLFAIFYCRHPYPPTHPARIHICIKFSHYLNLAIHWHAMKPWNSLSIRGEGGKEIEEGKILGDNVVFCRFSRVPCDLWPLTCDRFEGQGNICGVHRHRQWLLPPSSPLAAQDRHWTEMGLAGDHVCWRPPLWLNCDIIPLTYPADLPNWCNPEIQTLCSEQDMITPM